MDSAVLAVSFGGVPMLETQLFGQLLSVVSDAVTAGWSGTVFVRS